MTDTLPTGEPDNRSIEALIVALQNENSQIRWTAAEALGKLGDPRAIAPLIAVLDDEHWHVRCNAAEALGKLGDTPALEALLARLQHLDKNTQIAVAKALGILGDRRAVDSLVNAFSRPSSASDTRVAIIEALSQLADQRVLDLLSSTLRQTQDEAVFEATAKALERLGAPPQVLAAERSRFTKRVNHEALASKSRRRMLLGLALSVGGIAITICSYSLASSSSAGGYYVLCFGPIIWGIVLFIAGAFGWLRSRV